MRETPINNHNSHDAAHASNAAASSNGNGLSQRVRTKPSKRLWARISDSMSVQLVGIVLLALALITGLIGYADQHPEGFTFTQFIEDFYTNISTELASIAITVLIIDSLNRRRESRLQEAHTRDQLTRQFGSSVNEVARRAAEELRARGWLTDGTLQEHDLRGAHLEDAKLWDADLQGVNFTWAKLKNANLNRVNFVGADLTQANLTAASCKYTDLRSANLFEAKLYRVNFLGADLRRANLKGAHLENSKLNEADLRGAILDDACFDEMTIMPDGEAWTPDTDIARFTDSHHAAHWSPHSTQDMPRIDVGDE